MNRLDLIEEMVAPRRMYQGSYPSVWIKGADLVALLAVARAASTPPQDRPWLTQYRQDIEDALAPLMMEASDD